MADEFDLAIIGSGPGGYTAAIRASQLGMNTALIERDSLGGVCLNWGCIPSKALLRSAEIYQIIRRADDFGIKLDNLGFDFQKIIKRSRRTAQRLSKGVEYLMGKNKITVYKGSGRFSSKGNIDVIDEDGKIIDSLTYKNAIISTGARPRSLPNVAIDRMKIITSSEAMNLETFPESMVIIGGGAIGVEFGYFYNAFGCEVTLMEMMPSILPLEDSEITDVLSKSLSKSRIEILTDCKVESVDTTSEDIKVIASAKGDKIERSVNIVLMAVGVQGNIENIGLEELGIETERGFITVDETLQTTVHGIYAIGDIVGPPLLAHVASAEGVSVVDTTAGMERDRIDYGNIPSCTYCQPQVASTGLTEEQAKKEGYEVKIGRFPFQASGKAIAIGESEGLVKLIFDAEYGQILGGHIVGAEATEMIAELCTAKALESTYHELLKTPHAHPTLSEAVMEAAGQAYGEAINI